MLLGSGTVVGGTKGGTKGGTPGGRMGLAGVMGGSSGLDGVPLLVPPVWMNGMNTAGIIANGSQEWPPPAVMIGAPGAVVTNSGGASSTGTTTGGTATSLGTGTTDSSTGAPCASGASGRTGRHITTVVECAITGFTALVAAFGTARLTLRTSGRRGLTAALTGGVTGFLTGGLTAAGFLARGTTRRGRVASFFFAGAATGEHSTSESTDDA